MATAAIGTDLEYAISLLEGGELVAIPTETVYGLAGNACDPYTVANIFHVKHRPSFNPVIVHIGKVEDLGQWVSHVPDIAAQLAEAFWPGPMTLLLPRSDKIPDLITAGGEKVGIRIPSHPLTLELLHRISFPLAAPSANPFGYISPTTSQHVFQQLGGHIPYILDGGPALVGLESTILEVEADNQIIVHRLGGLGIEKIEAIGGTLRFQTHAQNKPNTPGQIKSHYAPGTPLILGDISLLLSDYTKEEVGILSWDQLYVGIPVSRQRVLSQAGDLTEAAAHLFLYMRELDEMGLAVILAENVPDVGLGKAINDRLQRAQALHKPLN